MSWPDTVGGRVSQCYLCYVPSRPPPLRRTEKNEQGCVHTQTSATPVTHTNPMQLVCSLTYNLASHALGIADAPRERHVFCHQRLAPAVNGTQDTVLHHADNVVLSGFL